MSRWILLASLGLAGLGLGAEAAALAKAALGHYDFDVATIGTPVKGEWCGCTAGPKKCGRPCIGCCGGDESHCFPDSPECSHR